jgi:hypothetical protein
VAFFERQPPACSVLFVIAGIQKPAQKMNSAALSFSRIADQSLRSLVVF